MKKCEIKNIVELEMDILEDVENDFGFYDNPDF